MRKAALFLQGIVGNPTCSLSKDCLYYNGETIPENSNLKGMYHVIDDSRQLVIFKKVL